MEQVLINHPKLYVHLTTGTEGPKHDPYGYQEYAITTPNGVTVLHEGLGVWISFRGEMLSTPHGEHYIRKHMFPALTGYTVEQIERIHRRLKDRCLNCGSRDFRSESGYPGETFDVCSDCGHVVNVYFDRRAIE